MASSGRKPARPRTKERTEPTTARTTETSTSAAATAPRPSPALAAARRAAQLCLDFKATDVVLLDLRGVSDMTDYFIVASGTSDTHVRSVGERLIEEMKKEGSPAHHIEGLQSGRWVLLDFVDFVVHLFHPTLRNFYQLERLWSDAEVIPIESSGAGA